MVHQRAPGLILRATWQTGNSTCAYESEIGGNSACIGHGATQREKPDERVYAACGIALVWSPWFDHL